mmetsp:Transcript_10857/g.17098  ORF Transcript_10857/g.17098 Transcript_10857/m.17098 type:complete len:1210 (-) Transcript_10857:22-3651(-)
MASAMATSYVCNNMESSYQEEESVDDQLMPAPSSWFENSTPAVRTNESFSEKNHGEVENDATQEEEEEVESRESQDDERDTRVAGLKVPVTPVHYAPVQAVGHTHPSPSWHEISSQVLPAAARELLSSSLRRIYYTARLSYARGRWHRKYSDIGNNTGGFSLSSSDLELPSHISELPSFSSLPWVDRQLVKEWRTFLPGTSEEAEGHEDFDFDRARTLVPNTIPKPVWQKSDVCHTCHKPFGPTRLRHHCRLCGHSFCQQHSALTHSLPHLGYDPDVQERVCDGCKRIMTDQNLAERIAWRLARCRDYTNGEMTPYFETGLDSAEEVALRITKAAIAMAKSIPLGAQATVAVETVDVLRKYGLHGIYGIMLRQEFLAAADLLRRALGINQTSWPLSVHELSAAIFYALAQHRAMRGLSPDREELIHTLRVPLQQTGVDERTTVPSVIDNYELSALEFHNNPVIDQTDTYTPNAAALENLSNRLDSPITASRNQSGNEQKLGFTPVCDPVPDSVLASLVFYAPIALNFIYADKEVDMQLLAAQQGWRLLYASLNQETEEKLTDRPGSALFLHQELRVACIAVRGTATINDVVTDIRQIPVPFPDTDPDQANENEGDWTNVFKGQGVALCGMAAAAVNLFQEHIDSLLYFAKQGYKIRVTGHSLGGGVATMIGVLILRHLERYSEFSHNLHAGSRLEETDLLRVYAFGTPSCVDAKLAEAVDPFVTTVILHDDVFPRLTPTSCRGLLKHLLHIRETWVKTHIEDDLRAVGERARTAWAPKFRQSFTLKSSSRSIKKYCKKQIQKGKKGLMSVKGKIALGDPGSSDVDADDCNRMDGSFDDESYGSPNGNWGEKFFVPADSPISQKLDATLEAEEEGGDDDERGDGAPEPQLLLEFLGGIDNRTEGLVIDGDEFFDTEDDLVEQDDLSESCATECFADPLSTIPGEPLATSDSWSMDIHASEVSKEKQSKEDGSDSNDVNDAAPVVLEETPLPRMFVPGKVIHIYSYRGVYKAAFVPRTFRELRRISLAGNMLSNHSTKSYYESLLEVQTARAAPESPPRWTAFDEDDTCCCCASRFTWASTCDSEAQQARDKHNCRSCGGLVCDPCAKNRLPMPSIGITVPVRVCDRCYNDMGGISTQSSSMTSSFLAVDEDEHAFGESPNKKSPGDPTIRAGSLDQEPKSEERPERKREKRSMVVDDLANRMRASALSSL